MTHIMPYLCAFSTMEKAILELNCSRQRFCFYVHNLFLLRFEKGHNFINTPNKTYFTEDNSFFASLRYPDERFCGIRVPVAGWPLSLQPACMSPHGTEKKLQDTFPPNFHHPHLTIHGILYRNLYRIPRDTVEFRNYEQ
jgi:hypothetical protein